MIWRDIMNNEETKVKEELDGLKKVKGLDFNLTWYQLFLFKQF